MGLSVKARMMAGIDAMVGPKLGIKLMIAANIPKIKE